MTGPGDQPDVSRWEPTQPSRPADQASPPVNPSVVRADANRQVKVGPAAEPPSPLGSDAPNRWLTTDPPDDIDALRSSSSLGYRTRSSRRRRGNFRIGVVPVMITIVILGGLAAWQLGLVDSVISPTPDVQTALNNAGFQSVTATIIGETAILTGSVESEAALNQVSAVALSVTGIRQVDNQLAVPVTDRFATLEAQIHAALASAGFDNFAVMIDGETVTLGGTVPNEESLSEAALAVLAVPGVAQLDNRLEIGPVNDSADLELALLAALTAEEFAYVRVEVQNGLATLAGSVPTEEARSQVVATAGEIDGIEKIDNRLIIDPDLAIGPALPPDQLEAAASTALAEAGIRTVTATVEGRRAILDGTVPLEVLGAGFFAFVEQAETAVLSVDGIDQVTSRLTLRGDGEILRRDLQTLLETAPVEFALGSSALTSESQAVLDQVALVIQAQPGLQIIIAGHTDAAGSNETNQALARDRAGTVLNYLLTRGVPPYRLMAVSYGELFPDQEASAEQNRRIEFEVGP